MALAEIKVLLGKTFIPAPVVCSVEKLSADEVFKGSSTHHDAACLMRRSSAVTLWIKSDGVIHRHLY